MSTAASQKTMFSRLLIAIDGSDASMDAADYAIPHLNNIMQNFMLCMLYTQLTLIYLDQLEK
jgi:hypothetical protein